MRSLTIVAAAVTLITGLGGATTASAAGPAVTRGPDGIVVTGGATSDQLWGSRGAGGELILSGLQLAPGALGGSDCTYDGYRLTCPSPGPSSSASGRATTR